MNALETSSGFDQDSSIFSFAMGWFDVYCFICGAATREVKVVPRQMKDVPNEFGRVEPAYDEDVIGDEDMEWFQKCRLIGFHPDAPGKSKYYVTDPGGYMGYGEFDFCEGSESRSVVEDFDPGVLNFGEHGVDTNRVFPFHGPCYELLARVLTGTWDTKKVNKGALFKAFGGLISEEIFTCPNLDYGDACKAQEQEWESLPGYEYTIINPEPRRLLVNDIIEVIKGEDFLDVPSDLALGHKVVRDPFDSLPEALIRDILSYLDNQSIFNLCQESRGVFALFRHDRSFWEDRIRNYTPYFEELVDAFTTRYDSLVTQDPRKILSWAENASRPRVGISGFLLPVANRRRIWSVCEQIAREYHPNCPSEPDTTCEMQKIAVGNKMHFVGCNGKSVFDVEQSYWIQTWDEYDDPYRPWTLKTFWNSDWDLTGITVKFNQEEPRMFGRQGTEEGAWETTKDLPCEIWIKGFIYFYDDTQVTYGQTDASLMQRPLFAAEDMVIVGLQGQLGNQPKEGVTPWILRLGLLQAYPGDDEKPDPGYFPDLRPTEELSWSSESLSLLDAPIWESETFKFVPGNVGHVGNTSIKIEHIPMRFLMLANHPSELKKVQRISACVRSKGSSQHGKQKYFEYTVTNLRASFNESENQPARTIRDVDDDGTPFPEQDWEDFEIDGPGGEIVEEIAVVPRYESAPKLLELRTNRNRTVAFAADRLAGEDDMPTDTRFSESVEGERRLTIKADDGDVIVGIVMGFGHRQGHWERLLEPEREMFQTRPWTYEVYQRWLETYLFSSFSVVGVLTMSRDA
ncbi:Activator of stress related protein [Fusarium albosuccineum]|uniref:Activator of stress related protein n=1 Tax=Fusarium albosuccineum TaxID=1237068 RepID=A0A8H4LJM0_9HYPO|nr:Activator of stress related protein [Fusarium albosuccineum]